KGLIGGVGANYKDRLSQEQEKEETKEKSGNSSLANVGGLGIMPSSSGGLGSSPASIGIGGSMSGIGKSAGDSAGRIRNVNIVIDKVVESFNINTTNLREDMSRVKDMVTEVLASAINDVNYVTE
ncbi:MAG: hypothetical protein ACRC3G_05485, partial [Bacteroidales bacterium]